MAKSKLSRDSGVTDGPIDGGTVDQSRMVQQTGESSHNGADTAPVAAPAKPVESKSDRFRRLGNHRLPRVVKAIQSMTNLANRNQYEYTEEQKLIVMQDVQDAVERMRNAFNGATASSYVARL